MNKQLIGATNPCNAFARTCIAIIGETLSLEHINMRQPVIDMIAALRGEHPADTEFNAPVQAQIADLGYSIADAETALAFSLRTLRKDFFIKRVEAALQRSQKTVHAELFSGSIISGIRTELEAQWVRNQGGLMVHIHHFHTSAPVNLVNEKPGDISIELTDQRPTVENLAESILQITYALDSAEAA